MVNQETKNDTAWNLLFEKYDILNKVTEEGRYIISSNEIKESKREPRLMTKFDNEEKLPNIFSKNELSILPITRGKYIISDFKTHHKLEDTSSNIIRCEFPSYIESIDPNNINSESVALNISLATGMLSHFTNDECLVPTVNGRRGSGNFVFDIMRKQSSETLNINVSNSQIEIDGAFEGINYLSLIEAKIDNPVDFIIRQLYYPFRALNNHINKEIKNIFFFYSNGIFSFYEYSFINIFNYNSLKLKKQCNYILYDGDILLEDITGVYETVEIVNEPQVPFPQANRFERVISLCEHLKKESLTKEMISEKYSFSERQSHYYGSAGIYLGLIKKIKKNSSIYYELTSKGKNIFNMMFKEKQLELVKCILEHKIFYNTFKYCVEEGKLPSKEIYVELMKKSNLYNINSEKTFGRRASTINGWIKWILKLEEIGDNN